MAGTRAWTAVGHREVPKKVPTGPLNSSWAPLCVELELVLRSPSRVSGQTARARLMYLYVLYVVLKIKP